jgi:hypothetical protein
MAFKSSPVQTVEVGAMIPETQLQHLIVVSNTKLLKLRLKQMEIEAPENFEKAYITPDWSQVYVEIGNAQFRRVI